jgi:hypothetical protein
MLKDERPTSNMLKDEHRTSNVQHRMFNEKNNLEQRTAIE